MLDTGEQTAGLKQQRWRVPGSCVTEAPECGWGLAIGALTVFTLRIQLTYFFIIKFRYDGVWLVQLRDAFFILAQFSQLAFVEQDSGDRVSSTTRVPQLFFFLWRASFKNHLILKVTSSAIYTVLQGRWTGGGKNAKVSNPAEGKYGISNCPPLPPSWHLRDAMLHLGRHDHRHSIKSPQEPGVWGLKLSAFI